MIKYEKSQQGSGIGLVWSVCEYVTPDDYDKQMEEYNEFRKSGKTFGGPHPPICGGPIIAYFTLESLADEYIKFKTERLYGK